MAWYSQVPDLHHAHMFIKGGKACQIDFHFTLQGHGRNPLKAMIWSITALTNEGLSSACNHAQLPRATTQLSGLTSLDLNLQGMLGMAQIHVGATSKAPVSPESLHRVAFLTQELVDSGSQLEAWVEAAAQWLRWTTAEYWWLVALMVQGARLPFQGLQLTHVRNPLTQTQ